MKGVSIGKRTGSLLLAVTLAALASVALISYVHGLEKRAYAGVETVDVYVARDTIPAGTTAEDAVERALFSRTPVPRKVVAEGAVKSLDELRGRVADVTILKGEQIVGARFVSPTEASSGLPIPDGHQAFSVEVEPPHGVAGFVTPGSHVSVIGHVDAPRSERDGQTVARSKYIVQDALVLAVGPYVALTPNEGSRAETRERDSGDSTRVLLTLAVTPGEAEKLAYADFEGELAFTLLPAGAKPVKTPGRTKYNEFR